jgi:hypothetical protein
VADLLPLAIPGNLLVPFSCAAVTSMIASEADGLLTSEQHVVDGRVRRVYRATKAGRRALAQDRAALSEPAREVLGPPYAGQEPPAR